MVQIFAAHIYDAAEFLKEKISYDLPPVVHEKILRYHFEEDRKRAWISQLLLYYVLSEKYFGKKEFPEFSFNEFGKPYLKNFPEIHFNISHSGVWAVCAVSEKDVGVDIERITPIDYNELKDFFSGKEQESFDHISECDRLEYFYSLWTLKESYIKAIGLGLQLPLNSFSIEIGGEKIFLTAERAENFFFRELEIDPDYKLSICAKENLSDCELTILRKEIFFHKP